MGEGGTTSGCRAMRRSRCGECKGRGQTGQRSACRPGVHVVSRTCFFFLVATSCVATVVAHSSDSLALDALSTPQKDTNSFTHGVRLVNRTERTYRKAEGTRECIAGTQRLATEDWRY